jgi:hypothetical protein
MSALCQKRTFRAAAETWTGEFCFGNDKGCTATSARQFALQAAQFEERISKLEDCHEGDDEDQLINEMEARGEIPSAEDFRAGRIRVIVHLKLFQPGQPALRSPSSM